MSSSNAGNKSVNERSNNLKHYTENSRLQEVFNLYSYLEEKPFAEEVQDSTDQDPGADIEGIAAAGQEDSDTTNGLRLNNNGNVLQNKRIIDRLRQFLIGRLFKINHVILDNEAINPLLYQLILLFEFIQMLFFIYAGVQIYNTFGTYQESSATTSTSNNQVNTTSGGYNVIVVIPSIVSTISEDPNVIHADSYFLFSVFTLYPLQAKSTNQFIVLYAIFVGLFYFTVALMYSFADNLYSAQRKQELKDGSILILKALSLFMNAYMTFLQIPLIILCLQGYLCDEDPSVNYTLGIQCGSTLNQILSVISSVTIVIYLIFQIVQQLLHASGHFLTDLPWGSMDRNVPNIRVLLKLVITASFMLDKVGTYRTYTSLACSLIGLVLVYKRLVSGLIFNRRVYYATVIQEFQISWLFLNVSLLQLREQQISAADNLMLGFAGLVIILPCLVIVEYRSTTTMIQAVTRRPDQLSLTSNFLQAEMHIFRLLNLIKVPDPATRNIVFGMISQHLDICTDPICQCQKMFETSGVKFQQLILQQWQNEFKEKYARTGQSMKAMLAKKMIRNNFTIKTDLEEQKNTTLIKVNTQEVLTEKPAASALQSISPKLSLKDEPVINRRKQSEGDHLDESPRKQFALGKLNDITTQPSIKSQGTTKIKHFDRQSGTLKINQSGDTNLLVSGVTIMQTAEEMENEEIQAQGENDKETINEEIVSESDMLIMFNFLGLVINQSIAKFPKCVELKLHSSYLLSEILMNEFKAIFELMKGDLCDPSIYNRFFIFRRRIYIERVVIVKNQQNLALGGRVDAYEQYKYEKLILRFQKLNYLAANSALGFWRELLMKNIDSNVLMERGAVISSCCTQIQDIATSIIKISPNDIKFLQLYASFLKQIANNEQEAQIQHEKAQSIFQRILSTKNRLGGGTTINHDNPDQINEKNEDLLFGENSAVGILMISMDAEIVGKMIHANDEVRRILGYTKKDLIDKKINTIQPYPIAGIHDRILRRFLNTAKRTVLNHQIDLFAMNKEGYLQTMNIIVKLYPQISDRIVIVGWFQNIDRLERMFSSKAIDERILSQTDRLQHHYLMTEQSGRIACVTQGLSQEVGLNSKFFSIAESFAQAIMIDDIFESQIIDPYFKDDLVGPGIELMMNTTKVLEKVNIELLSHEEIQDVRACVGSYYVHVQHLPLVFEDFNAKINLYKIVILPQGKQDLTHQGTNLGGNNIQSQFNERIGLPSTITGGTNDIPIMRASAINDASSMSGADLASQGSSASSTDVSVSYNKLLSDFRTAIARKDTPKHLILLNRILIIICILSIVISGVDYDMKMYFIADSGKFGNSIVRIESRSIKFMQIQAQIRSFINIANGVEFDFYSEGSLKKIDRFQFLKEQIQKESYLLQEVLDLIQSDHTLEDEDLGVFEQQMIPLLRLSNQDKIEIIDMPFRVALNTYMNSLLSLKVATREKLILPDYLLKASPNIIREETFIEASNSSWTASSIFQKELFSMVANSLRIIRQKMEESNSVQMAMLKDGLHEMQLSSFLALMIVGIIVSIISLILIIYQIMHNEQSKMEIMSVFALLENDDVKRVYDMCDRYIDIFEMEHEDNHERNDSQNDESSSSSKILKNDTKSESSNGKYRGNKKRRGSRAPKQAQDPLNALEDSKEPDYESSETQQIVIKKPHKKQFQIPTQQEFYSQMLKKSMRIMKNEHIPTKQKVPENREAMNNYVINEPTKKNKSMLKIMGVKNNTKAKMMEQVFPQENGLRRSSVLMLSPNQSQVKEQKLDSSSENEESFIELQHKKALKEAKIAQIREKEKESEDATDVQQRKNMLNQTQSQKRSTCKNMVIINLAIFAFYFTYFIYIYAYHEAQIGIIKEIQDSTPIFFQRYTSLIASYSFLRERIINNNSRTFDLGFYPQIQVTDPIANQSIDWYYHTNSMAIEKITEKLKVSRPSGIATLIDHESSMDSESFCATLFDNVVKTVEVYVSTQTPLVLQENAKVAYQDLLNTVIAACNYAYEGNLAKLQLLVSKSVNFNTGNYDNRTPLHFACAAGDIAVVKYLLLWGVKVNPKDRWGSTPLDSLLPFPDIYALLVKKGAVRGNTLTPFDPLFIVVKETQIRMYYAALKNNVDVLEGIRLNGWQVNVQDYDGRTALGIAASAGNLEAVKYLLSFGADLNLKDQRGNDAFDDASRENRSSVVNYLVNEGLGKEFCLQFEDGLLQRGLQYAIGIFQKKFADLQNSVSIQTSNAQLLALLGGPRFATPPTVQTFATMRSFEVFLTTCELFLNKVINQLTIEVQSTFDQFNVSYTMIAQIVFFSFLAFQLICLFVLRKRFIRIMRQDVMKSRSILNLIPEAFFKNHSHAVEKIIKTLQM